MLRKFVNGLGYDLEQLQQVQDRVLVMVSYRGDGFESRHYKAGLPESGSIPGRPFGTKKERSLMICYLIHVINVS